MKTLLTTIALSFILCSSVLGQTYGYMGKKNSVDVGISISPNFTNALMGYPESIRDTTNNNKRYSFSSFSIKAYPMVSLSRTVGNNFDVSIRAGYQTFQLYYAPQEFVRELLGYNSFYGALVKQNQVTTGSSTLFELDFKFNLKEYLSPIGRYYNFGLGVYRTRVNEEEVTVGIYDNNNWQYSQFIESVTLKNETITLKRIHFGVHSKKIISSNFYIDTGVELSVIFGAGKYTSQSDYLTEEDLEDTYLQDIQKRTLNWNNILTLKLSVGRLF
jgi:hypothetical protein